MRAKMTDEGRILVSQTRPFCYLGDSVLDHLLVGQIALVANQQLVDTLRGITVNLGKPLLDVREGILVRDIIDDNDTMGTTVVGRGDGAETLLSSSVPLLVCLECQKG